MYYWVRFTFSLIMLHGKAKCWWELTTCALAIGSRSFICQFPPAPSLCKLYFPLLRQKDQNLIPGSLAQISSILFFKNIFIYYAITVVPFPPTVTPLHLAHPLPPTFHPYCSCPWVILISSLASTCPTLFLPSPCLFSTCHLCYLFSVPFPPSPPPTPLLTTLHVISISMVLFLF